MTKPIIVDVPARHDARDGFNDFNANFSLQTVRYIVFVERESGFESTKNLQKKSIYSFRFLKV